MNVDEAMALFGPGNKKFWTLQSGDHFNAGETLAAEVERLRAELTVEREAFKLLGNLRAEVLTKLAETKAENVGLEEGHDRLEAEVERLRAELAIYTSPKKMTIKKLPWMCGNCGKQTVDCIRPYTQSDGESLLGTCSNCGSEWVS